MRQNARKKTMSLLHIMALSSLPAVFRRLTLVSGLLAALASAHAEDLADLQRLARNGQHAEALTRIDAALASKPHDAQMLFLKGLILAEHDKTGEALAIFMALSKDHPQLPEPYNNMAVLYAASGKYEQARAALEAAIRIAPAYTAAHENLGDLHLRLARQSYEKALQLDGANAGVKSKLKLASSALSGIGEHSASRSLSVQRMASEPARPAAASATDAEIAAVVADWAKAWSAQDVPRYLSFYSSDFETPGRQARAAWESSRRARIVNKGKISVTVETPQVTVNGSSATVSFMQVYASDRFKEHTRKTLLMTRQDGGWKIRREIAGD